ncbi:MAG: hypothetical protein IJ560_04280 [Alphaproteobacteria bacterium]|nr:hypothetical protein [Alphaproteobacteria bacterium]
MSRPIIVIPMLAMAACNSVNIKTHSLDTTQTFYVDRGGYQMQHEIKNVLESRGYSVTVGHKRQTTNTTYIVSENPQSVISTSDIGKSRYIVQISEGTTRFMPVWCALNGFWWWRFNVSISDNVTGQELLGWAGRGCANSSLQKLNDILDKMEM